jgi:predicted nuclease of predicted toxin-antitoxin system
LKVFFDEDVPHKLVRLLPEHDICTVVSMDWGGIKNGALLTLIGREGFQVFLTGDKNMETQQRLEGRPFAVLIMSAINCGQAACSQNCRRSRCSPPRYSRANRLWSVQNPCETSKRMKRAPRHAPRAAQWRRDFTS